MTGPAPSSPLLDVTNLVVQFRSRGKLLSERSRTFNAVNDVSLQIMPGESLGLVGESGCGKTSFGRAILMLNRPAAGKIHFDGTSITDLPAERLRTMRRHMQMVFQDPYSSLDPRMTVGQIVGEPVKTHEPAPLRTIREKAAATLEIVGIDPRRMDDYPHQFSGGQRQRIGIARALAVRPKFIVCDEATSALDVSVRAQILNLLVDLRQRYGLTYLLISHDLGSLRHMSDRIGVMYLGKLVEIGPVSAMYETPGHPYTQSLLSAMPVPDPRLERARKRIVLSGDVPSPQAAPTGCCFHTRCWLREHLGRPARCHEQEPELRATMRGTKAACHFSEEAAAQRPVTSSTDGVATNRRVIVRS